MFRRFRQNQMFLECEVNSSMSKLLKSKLGIVFAVTYLLVIFLAILEQQNSRPEPMDELGLLFLTAPWSFIFLVIFEFIGIVTKENYFVLYALITLGGLINALILYLLGSLITKILSFFRRKEVKLD